jgi:transposase
MAWKSGRPYSQDLRERIIATVDGGMGVYEAAPLFQVSVSYIYKALARRRLTGETTARQQRGSSVAPRLAAHEDALRARVASHSDATIAELRAWLLADHGVSASHGSVWSALDRLNLTHKKTAPRGRARPAGRRRSAHCLARAAAPLKPETAGVHR